MLLSIFFCCRISRTVEAPSKGHLWITSTQLNKKYLMKFRLTSPVISVEFLSNFCQRISLIQLTCVWFWSKCLEFLMLRKTEGKRRRGQQRMRWLDSIIDSIDMSWSRLREIADRGAWFAAVHGVAKGKTKLSD